MKFVNSRGVTFMIMNYGSFAYFLFIGCAVIGVAVLALILKRFSLRVQKGVILAIALINLFQHLFKFIVYPNYWGTGFNYVNTAYNMCALLIITEPFAILSKKQSWKDFMYCAGCIAGLLPLLLPTWFIGKSVVSWEFFRFYVCHVLLFFSSALPFILKHHRLGWKNWYKYPAYFTLYLVIILLDLIFAVYLGLVDGASPETLHQTLYNNNPLWMMHPSSEFAWVEKILDPITPDAFFSDGYYVPILWYLYPMCILIAVIGFILGAVTDRKNFIADFKRYKTNIKNIFAKIKRNN